MDQEMRIGFGHDTHRFGAEEESASLRLGGIDIPFSRALVGHSDADVLLHAVTDALLGAAALGDIGDHFPDTDESLRGADSAKFLWAAAEKVRQKGYEIVNIDTILFVERPKIGADKSRMAARIADLLGLAPECVNVKAKTGERLGPIGRGEGISAEAIALLKKI